MAVKIFVSVGTHPQQFDRLLEEVDRLVGKGQLKADVFAQTGNSSYVPKNFAFKKFLNDKQYSEQIREAGIVVSHGGAGTIINALRNKKPLVIVPRLQRFGEHTNDHQLDLAMALAGRGKAIAVREISGLGKALERAGGFRPGLASDRDGLIKEVGCFLHKAGESKG